MRPRGLAAGGPAAASTGLALLALMVLRTTLAAVHAPLEPREQAALAMDVAVLAAGTMGCCFLLVLHLRDSVEAPLRDVRRSLKAIGDGVLDERAPEAGPPGVRTLAAAVNQAAASLETWRRRTVQEADVGAMGMVLTGVSHEVRNPLAFMAVSERMLLKQAESDLQQAAPGEQQARARERIQMHQRVLRGVDRLEDLANALQEAGTGGGVAAMRDLHRLVRAGLVAVQSRMYTAGIEAATDLQATRKVLCRGDETTHIIAALLVNACEAMPDGGTVTVCTRDVGDQVELVVEDTGEGVAPSLGDRVFEPFVTGRPGHAGLGLAMAAEAAARQGGSLALDPSGSGGARFVLRLPAV